MNTKNRVWIELERASEPETCHNRAAAAARMLAKLGLKFDGYPAVFFDEQKGLYAFTISSDGSFVWAEDRGHWFSLDKLSA